MKSPIIVIIMLLIATANSYAASPLDAEQTLKNINLPDAFSISLFAGKVTHVRTLALGDSGIIYAGTRRAGKVYALQDTNGDGKADRRYTIASGLNMPNGVAYKEGTLYVAEGHRIIRFKHIDQHLDNPPAAEVVYDKLPNKKHHGWKYLRFGPDGKLYTAVGAPCNICFSKQKIFATLVRMNTNGSEFEIIGQGIRNTVGYDWQPNSGKLFFTENGRDWMGDNLPPDELNQWKKVGEHFGYPYCHAGTLLDPEFGKGKKCSNYKAPVWKFKAHMAPLGLRFYQGDMFPAAYKNQLFVALHGSWNRSKAHGYRIALVKFKQGLPVSEQVFADGWLTKEGEVLGRPTDILEMPDGSLLVADDLSGIIYRITYQK